MELQAGLSDEIDEHGCAKGLCTPLIMQYHEAVFKRRRRDQVPNAAADGGAGDSNARSADSELPG
jgi:hypothetical protein